MALRSFLGPRIVTACYTSLRLGGIVAVVIASTALGAQQDPPATIDGVSDKVQEARTIAGQIECDTRELMDAVLDSPWGSRYGMLKPSNPDRGSIEYSRIKERERIVRDDLAAVLGSHPDIELAFLAYEEFIMFVERRFDSPEERSHWVEQSGGDMYVGPYATLVSGVPCCPDSAALEPDVVTGDDSQLVGIPICRNGRYVCALYVRFVSARSVSPDAPRSSTASPSSPDP